MTNRTTFENVRLAFEPELKFASSGKAFCRIRFADQKRRKNDAGQWEDASAPMWVSATVFGDTAEALAEHAHKNDRVTVTGQLIAREWEKDGEKRSGLEVDFATVAVVPSAPKSDRSAQPSSGYPWATSGSATSDFGTPPF